MQFKTDLEDIKKKRFFKVKNANKNFLCALCKSPRQMKYAKNLTEFNYIQIVLLSAFLSWLLYPVMGLKALSLVLVIWPIFEVTNKMLYRREIPCPYCGFDATWYRRDVKVAKRKVEDFWKERLPEEKEERPAEPVKVRATSDTAEIHN